MKYLKNVHMFGHKDMIEEWTLKKTEITWKRSWCSRFKKRKKCALNLTGSNTLYSPIPKFKSCMRTHKYQMYYYLSRCFVTCTSFRNPNLIDNDTFKNPLKMGPCFLHFDSTFATYNGFFSRLEALLNNPVSHVEIKGDPQIGK